MIDAIFYGVLILSFMTVVIGLIVVFRELFMTVMNTIEFLSLMDDEEDYDEGQ